MGDSAAHSDDLATPSLAHGRPNACLVHSSTSSSSEEDCNSRQGSCKRRCSRQPSEPAAHHSYEQRKAARSEHEGLDLHFTIVGDRVADALAVRITIAVAMDIITRTRRAVYDEQCSRSVSDPIMVVMSVYLWLPPHAWCSRVPRSQPWRILRYCIRSTCRLIRLVQTDTQQPA